MTIISNIFQPSTAGLFYPSNSQKLHEMLTGLFNLARAEYKTNTKNRFQALIVPSAPYQYSGLTSAHAYKNFKPAYYNNIIVLAPAQQKHCEGLFVYPQAFSESPLGISPRQEISLHSGIQVNEKLFEEEYSAEVQLPFLQYRLLEEGIPLNSYPITLMLYGQIHPQKLAKKLQYLLNDKTLLVLSSNLSHYHNSQNTAEKDEKAIETILSRDSDRILQIEASGRIGISAFLRTKQANLCQAELLHYSTSSEENKTSGYSAISFSAGANKKNINEIVEVFLHANLEKSLNDKAQKEILGFLHFCLKEYLSSKTIPNISALAQRYPQLNEDGACFITLYLNNNLRGCMGSLQANKPLHQDLVVNCLKAGAEDERFKPLTLEELPEIKIEVSILKNIQFVHCRNQFELLDKIVPHKHGIILKQFNKMATFLPQVWEKTPQKIDFLNQLARKAQLKSPTAWQIPTEKVQIYTYEVFSFKDV